MVEFLRGWIINIVTISIILILFEILIPSGKIKKIINMVSGFIILIAVINPFLAIKSEGFNLSKSINLDSYYIDKKEVETSRKILEETQMRQISEVYKKKIALKIQDELKEQGIKYRRVNVTINEDYESEKYGEIKKVLIELERQKGVEQKNGNIESVSVKTVDIYIISKAASTSEKTEKKAEKSLSSEEKRLLEHIKQNLTKALEIKNDNIVLTYV